MTCLRLDEAEAGVLVEVRAEVEAREAGGLVPCVVSGGWTLALTSVVCLPALLPTVQTEREPLLARGNRQKETRAGVVVPLAFFPLPFIDRDMLCLLAYRWRRRSRPR